MTLRERLRVPVWLSPRAYWALGAIALCCAAGSVLAPLWWLAVAAAVFFVLALAADAITGPPRALIALRRHEADPFTLQSPAELRYTAGNASDTAVRTGIFEAGNDLLRYEIDELQARIPPQSAMDLVRPVMPVMRGSGELRDLYYWYENPLGLLRRRVRAMQATALRVYPDLSAVERYGALHARNRLIEAGLRRMRLRGAGTEPESVREWTAGDPFRAVNWKATARRGKLMVAQYEIERSQNVMILLDAGRLMTARAGEERKFDYAVTAALSVASIAALANDKVGLVAFAGEIVRAFAPRAMGSSLAAIAGLMHDLQPRFEEADYDAAFAYTRTHVRKRSLIVFFTDMLDPVAQSSVLAGIGTLSRRHVVVCVFMNDAAVENALAAAGTSSRNAYAADVALELREERRAAAASLSRMGVRVIDVPAANLTSALIDQYLEIKQRGLL